MTSTSLRETIRTALHDEWWRSIREKIEDAPDGHVERLTDAIMRVLGSEAVVLPLDDARRLFDLATDSPLICSGSFETDDVVVLRRLAVLIGADMAAATPSEFVRDFPHPFAPFSARFEANEVRDPVTDRMRWETDAEVYARLGEAPDRCCAGSYDRRCSRPAADPIHQAAEMGA